MFHCLLSSFNHRNLIETCCTFGNYEIADILLKSGKVDINMKDGSMKTALFKAVEEDNEDSVLYLLRNGADPHSKAYSEVLSSVVEPVDVSRYLNYTRITRILINPHASNMGVYSLSTALPGTPVAGECSICCDESDALIPLSGCGHAFCAECLHGWFMTRKAENKPLTCPQNGCSCKCSIYDVKAVMNDGELAEITHSVLISSLSLLEDFVWCPTPGCGSGMFVVVDGCANVTCPECKVTFCTKCFASHGEKSCRDKYDEMSSNNWLAANTKECPMCKVRIVKTGGCSHMRCSHCQYEFCWICMNKYIGKYSFNDRDPCGRA